MSATTPLQSRGQASFDENFLKKTRASSFGHLLSHPSFIAVIELEKGFPRISAMPTEDCTKQCVVKFNRRARRLPEEVSHKLHKLLLL
jgi:hypothetical protein